MLEAADAATGSTATPRQCERPRKMHEGAVAEPRNLNADLQARQIYHNVESCTTKVFGANIFLEQLSGSCGAVEENWQE